MEKEVPGKEGESEERECDVRRALRTTWAPLSVVRHGLSLLIIPTDQMNSTEAL